MIYITQAKKGIREMYKVSRKIIILESWVDEEGKIQKEYRYEIYFDGDDDYVFRSIKQGVFLMFNLGEELSLKEIRERLGEQGVV